MFGYFYDSARRRRFESSHTAWSGLVSARHPYNANKNNDNFDKAIKVKKINNIKRNVPRSCFFAFSIGEEIEMVAR